jgi:hypothetical protein
MELPRSWSTASASAPCQLLVVQGALLSVVVGGRDSLDSKLRSSPTLAVIVFVTNIGVVFLCTAQITRYSSSVICGLDGSSCVWRVERTQSHMGSCRHRSVLGYRRRCRSCVPHSVPRSRLVSSRSLYISHTSTPSKTTTMTRWMNTYR